MSINPDQQLDRIRNLANLRIDGGDATTEEWADMADLLAALVLDLDAHLTAGGIPPEAWREGPDAPGTGTWGWQGDSRQDDDRDGNPDEERPAPEGLAVFAHWSAAHDGINVEIDLPDSVESLTIHVNDAIVFRHGDTDSRIDTDDTLAGSPYFGA
jgi:hypothetical protein